MKYYVRPEVLMVVHMKITVFWKVTPCTLVNRKLMRWIPPERLNQSPKVHGVTCQKILIRRLWVHISTQKPDILTQFS
jgi:hypothetical protein